MTRYTLPALPFVLVLLAVAITGLPARAKRVALALLLALDGVALYHAYTSFDKDPWRQTAAWLASVTRPADVVVSTPHWTRRPLGYYFDPPAGVAWVAPQSAAGADSALGNAPRVWLVESYGPKSNNAREVRSSLSSRYTMERVAVVNDSLRMNPHGGHVVTIRVSTWRRND